MDTNHLRQAITKTQHMPVPDALEFLSGCCLDFIEGLDLEQERYAVNLEGTDSEPPNDRMEREIIEKLDERILDAIDDSPELAIKLIQSRSLLTKQ